VAVDPPPWRRGPLPYGTTSTIVNLGLIVLTAIGLCLTFFKAPIGYLEPPLFNVHGFPAYLLSVAVHLVSSITLYAAVCLFACLSQESGPRPPDLLIRGSAPGTQPPFIGSLSRHSALAMTHFYDELRAVSVRFSLRRSQSM